MKFTTASLLALVVGSAHAFSVVSPSGRATTALSESKFTGAEAATWEVESVGGTIVRCEGTSRKTFTFYDTTQDTVQVALTSEGRPVAAEVELWIGPDWTPFKMKAVSENGRIFPIQSLVGTRAKAAEIELRNIGDMAMPFVASAAYADPVLASIRAAIPETEERVVCQGGRTITSFPIEPGMEQVRVFLKTDTKQLDATVELLNGPNNVKQQYDIFTNNGVLNSFYAVFNTPGYGNMIRIINKAPLEFPCYAYVKSV